MTTTDERLLMIIRKISCLRDEELIGQIEGLLNLTTAPSDQALEGNGEVAKLDMIEMSKANIAPHKEKTPALLGSWGHESAEVVKLINN